MQHNFGSKGDASYTGPHHGTCGEESATSQGISILDICVLVRSQCVRKCKRNISQTQHLRKALAKGFFVIPKNKFDIKLLT